MKPQTKRLYRQLLVAALMMGGAFNLTTPVLAAGTYAGTGIVNRATATYEDPNDPLNQDADPNNNAIINATSNTVTIRVAEVAGITVISKAVTDTTPNTPLGTGDLVNFDFEVTNTGNDSTQFYIPNTATVSGGTIVMSGNNPDIQYSTDGGTTWLARPTGGALDGLVGPIAPNASILVRVPVSVTANAANANIVVTLGNTGTYDANNVGTNTQDQPDDGLNGDTQAGTNEVRTVDVAGEANPNSSLPVNGEREASARGVIKLGAVKEAFALVTKTRTGYSNNNTAGNLTDDRLTYSLGLEVKGISPDPQLSAGNLVGSPINLDNTTQSKILVSDAIPTNTVLSSVTTTLPTGWTIVYSTDDPATTNKPANDPTVAWLTYNPASPPTLSTVRRIGFIHDGPIAAGQSVTGLSFTVTTTGLTGTTKIANIAQVFAYTEGSTTLIYDESGDQNPNNYEGSSRPATNNPTNGVANPANDGEDPGNNNTATNSPAGEANVYTISAPGSILNGPFGKPDAVNTNTNDDFTNKSSAIAAGTNPKDSNGVDTKINPDSVTFQNTIKNPGSETINNLLLVPTPPSTTTDLPANTTVKLIYGSQTATYTYTGTVFNYTPQLGDSAIVINGLAAGADLNYTVQIDLPTGTDLSTNIDRGFPIPIVAFVDENNNGTFELPADSTTYNITINQVYTGFLKLTKQARILNADGTVIPNYNSPWFTTPTQTDLEQVRPGRIIEYQIEYKNISERQQTGTGVNNIQLNAGNVTILEDGTLSPNTWAKDNDNSGAIDTSHVAGQATSENNGVIQYFNDTTVLGTTDPGANATVTKYIDTLPNPLSPQESGTFKFQRKLDLGTTGTTPPTP